MPVSTPSSTGLPFSDGYRAGDLLFSAGQIGWDGTQLVKGFDEQVRLSLTNLQAALAGHGARVDQLVKVTIFLTDMSRFPRVNELYGDFVGTHRPARTCVQVAALPRGAEFEVEGVAHLG